MAKEDRNYAALAGVTNSSRRTDADALAVPAGDPEQSTQPGAAGEGMSEDELLSMLQRYEDDSAEYTDTTLREVRDSSIKAYYQRPYGNEEPGWSQIITSTVSDTVNWILPDLLDLFISTDEAVKFNPRRAAEVKGAQASTDGCNYIFWQQNSGFHILHNAFWDALVLRTCAIHWRLEEKRTKRQQVFTGPGLIPTLMQSGLLTDPGMEVVSIEEVPGPMVPTPVPMQQPGMPMQQAGPGMQPGQPQQLVPGPAMTRIRVSKVETSRRVRIDCFEPENLRIARGWTSPLLEGCPYVARDLEISLSDLNELCDQLGVDRVDAEDLKGSQEPSASEGDVMRTDRTGDGSGDSFRADRNNLAIDSDDETATMGWLRIEWVLADYDGDGIAELREVYRLQDMILHHEEVEAIPCATGSPLLVPHKWDGQSVSEALEDLQLLHTELMRGVVNNAYSSNNPRKVVLTDKNGATLVNMNDLLDSDPGGYIRTTSMDAIRMEPVEYVGNDFMPLLDMVENAVEKRSGVTRQRLGMDPNAINTQRTLGETRIVDQASKQRIKLMGRALGETIVKPMFKGVQKLATSGKVDKLFFELRGEFVEIDPNEWIDGYDMSVNVGLGTGDREAQEKALAEEFQVQMSLLPTPLGQAGVVTPQQVYNTRAKLLSLRGFKNTSDFYTQPPAGPLPQQPPPKPESVQVAEIRAQTEAQKFQAESRQDFEKAKLDQERKLQEQLQQNEIQRQNDERDHEREMARIEAEKQIRLAEIASADRNNQRDNYTRLLTAQISAKAKPAPGAEGGESGAEGAESGAPVLDDATAASVAPDDDIRNALAEIIEHQRMPRSIVYQNGQPVGVQVGDQFKAAVRDAGGNITGLQ